MAILAVTWLVLLAPAARAQAAPRLSEETTKRIESLIASEVARERIPGISVAIVTRDEQRWAGAYGFADLENHVIAKAHTSYRLGSISKPLTALAVMQLVHRGKIELDAPIQRYVPSFPAKRWPVRVRDLLCHVSGVRHYRPGEMTSTRHYDGVVSALSIFAADPLAAEPGARYLYTTYGYCLLGAAVESASGMRYDEYVREHILAPAGMHQTRVDDWYAIIPDRAAGYARAPSGDLRNSAMMDTSNKVPGGGWCGTVEDLGRLAIAVNTGKLLPPDVVNRMYVAQRLRDGRPIGYGFGWALMGEMRGHPAVGHAGGQPRISTLLYMVPHEGLAVCLMCNLEGLNLVPLARSIAEALEP